MKLDAAEASCSYRTSSARAADTAAISFAASLPHLGNRTHPRQSEPEPCLYLRAVVHVLTLMTFCPK